MPDDLVERQPDALIEFLHGACVAGCSCQTKSPEIVFHEPGCHYRLHIQSIDRITALTARLAALEQATPGEVVEVAALAVASGNECKAFFNQCLTRFDPSPLHCECRASAKRVVDAIAAPLRAQGAVAERERCIAAIESVAAEVESRLYYGNDMPKAWAASLRECVAAIRAGGPGG